MAVLLSRRIMFACLVTLALCLGALPAAAAAPPPGNDELSGAVRLALNPHTIRENTRNATFNPATDMDCVLGASVWFRIRVQQQRTVRLSTVGSSYDTVLGVFTGTPGSLTTIACNDDAVLFASAVEVTLDPATTYYVAVSACCTPAAAGGRLLLNVLSSRKLTASTVFESASAGRVSGRAFVSGEQTCSQPSAFQATATLSQRVGKLVARGTGSVIVSLCHPSASYSIAVDSETGVAFRKGKAVLTLDTLTSDGIETFTTPEITQTVTLSAVAGKAPQLQGRAVPSGGQALTPAKRLVSLLLRPANEAG